MYKILSENIHRYYLLRELYKSITDLLPYGLKSKSIQKVLSCWVMNEKKTHYIGMDPLLPDGHLAHLVINDFKDLLKVCSLPFDEIMIQMLCNQVIDHFRKIPHPKNVKVNYIIYKARFTDMFRFYILCKKYCIDIYIDIPYEIHNYLRSYLSQEQIVSLALRYKALNSLNHQLSLDPILSNLIHTVFDVKGELFASAFNKHITKHNHIFCSIFPDIEKQVGCTSSFFDFKPTKEGLYIVNPPYDLILMNDMSKNIINWLNSKLKLAFLLVLPVMDPEGIYKITGKISPYGEFNALKILKESNYIQFLLTVEQSKACFINKMTYRYCFPCNIHFVLVSNYNFPILKLNRILQNYLSNLNNFCYFRKTLLNQKDIESQNYSYSTISSIKPLIPLEKCNCLSCNYYNCKNNVFDTLFSWQTIV